MYTSIYSLTGMSLEYTVARESYKHIIAAKKYVAKKLGKTSRVHWVRPAPTPRYNSLKDQGIKVCIGESTKRLWLKDIEEYARTGKVPNHR
jgi:hypothetical protein